MRSLAVLLLVGAGEAVEEAPERDIDRDIRRDFTRDVERLTRDLATDPKDVGLYSRRGDAYFFLGEIRKALADYDKMLELEPELSTTHWRRGIALFYAGRHEQAARQFEAYHRFDRVDRENGIWRYLSQAKAFDRKRARRDLLEYERTDREPFPDLYEVFAGTREAGAVLDRIAAAPLKDAERRKRLFYAHLYLGLEADLEGRTEEAIAHLARAVANPWPRKAGYGPRFMWHVGRLHLERLR